MELCRNKIIACKDQKSKHKTENAPQRRFIGESIDNSFVKVVATLLFFLFHNYF